MTHPLVSIERQAAEFLNSIETRTILCGIQVVVTTDFTDFFCAPLFVRLERFVFVKNYLFHPFNLWLLNNSFNSFNSLSLNSAALSVSER